MNRLEQMAFNCPSMRNFVAEVLNIQEKFYLLKPGELLTAKELRELYIEVHKGEKSNG